MSKLITLLLLSVSLYAGTKSSTTDDSFLSSCNKFFYKKTPPSGFPKGLKYICQRYENSFYYATLYDTTNRIPLYSAYKVDYVKCEGKQPSRRDSWFIEPELADRDKQANMDTDKKSNADWVMPVQAVNDDYKDTGFDRGHLNPNFMHCGIARTATFSLTNSVPQDSCFNRIVWFDKEDELQNLFEKKCNFAGAQRYVITGAVPSNDSFIPQKDLIVEDMPDREVERVNVPSHMWTIACCDGSGSSAGHSFFYGHIGENKAGGKMEEYYSAADITAKLEELYGRSPMTFLADGCTISTDDIIIG